MHVHVARCDIVLHTIHVYILKDNEKLCDASTATCMQVCVCVWGGEGYCHKRSLFDWLQHCVSIRISAYKYRLC